MSSPGQCAVFSTPNSPSCSLSASPSLSCPATHLHSASLFGLATKRWMFRSRKRCESFGPADSKGCRPRNMRLRASEERKLEQKGNHQVSLGTMLQRRNRHPHEYELLKAQPMYCTCVQHKQYCKPSTYVANQIGQAKCRKYVVSALYIRIGRMLW
jgi:hypothetical protein